MNQLTIERIQQILAPFVASDVIDQLVDEIRAHELYLIGDDEPLPRTDNPIHYDFVHTQNKLRGKQRDRRLQ